MIKTYDLIDGKCLVASESVGAEIARTRTAAWVDLVDPTAAEITATERAFAIDIPTADEMKEIEVSARLYQDGTNHVMTARIVYRIDDPEPVAGDVTFIMTADHLITVRFATPRAFLLFANQAKTGDVVATTPAEIMTGLIEAVIERQADLIERVQEESETISRKIFSFDAGRPSRTQGHASTLTAIGRASLTATRTRESLVSLSRTLTYMLNMTDTVSRDSACRQRVKSSLQDVQSLAAQVDHTSQQIAFLMDATVGLVGIEQNQIIKLFSVVAVMLMPPTLIASVYGMNFQNMPELAYPWAYPITIAAMVVSAVVPFVYFKRKGWL